MNLIIWSNEGEYSRYWLHKPWHATGAIQENTAIFDRILYAVSSMSKTDKFLSK